MNRSDCQKLVVAHHRLYLWSCHIINWKTTELQFMVRDIVRVDFKPDLIREQDFCIWDPCSIEVLWIKAVAKEIIFIHPSFTKGEWMSWRCLSHYQITCCGDYGFGLHLAQSFRPMHFWQELLQQLQCDALWSQISVHLRYHYIKYTYSLQLWQ